MIFSKNVLKSFFLIFSFSYNNLFARVLLLVDSILSLKQCQNTFKSLVDINVTEYTFIDKIKA